MFEQFHCLLNVAKTPLCILYGIAVVLLHESFRTLQFLHVCREASAGRLVGNFYNGAMGFVDVVLNAHNAQ